MRGEIITSIIASVGVLLSALLSYLINRKMIQTERNKTSYGIESAYYNKITESRIMFYKEIYEVISEFLKDERTNGLITNRKRINRQSIMDFITKYDVLDSKYGVLYSAETGDISAEVRGIIYQILKNTDKDNFFTIFDSRQKKYLIKYIQKLESALKADLGIYILEYKDFDRSKRIRSYEDIERIKNIDNTEL